MYALTKIKGVGRRYSNLVCKKADVDLNKRYDSPYTIQLSKDWRSNMANGQHANEGLETVLVSSPPKSSSASSPLSRTPRSTRFPPGSSTDSAISLMARTLRSSPTASTPSCVTILSASRRSALTVVSDTTGASVSVVSTPRPPAAAAGPSVSPRRRVVKHYAMDYGIIGWTGAKAGCSIFLSMISIGTCFWDITISRKCTLESESLKTKSKAFKYMVIASRK